MPHGVLADREERGLDAVRRQCGEHGWRIVGPGSVVKGEHDLLVAEEIMLLEVLEPEARPASGVDLYYARDSKHRGVVPTCGRIGERRLRGEQWRRFRPYGSCGFRRRWKRRRTMRDGNAGGRSVASSHKHRSQADDEQCRQAKNTHHSCTHCSSFPAMSRITELLPLRRYDKATTSANVRRRR